MSTIYPNSAKVLNRDPDFMGVPFQYHSIFSFGSSVGVRRASKRALSPSRRCSRLERGITNAGGGRVLPLPGFVWWKNGDSCGSYRYECPWSKLNKEQASSTNFFKSTVPLFFFFVVDFFFFETTKIIKYVEVFIPQLLSISSGSFISYLLGGRSRHFTYYLYTH